MAGHLLPRLTATPARATPAARIVFEGTPADLAAARSTRTGEHLAAYPRRTRSPPGQPSSCRD